MKYGIDFRYLAKGAASPSDNSYVVDVELDRQIPDAQDRGAHDPRILGSRASRKPSPSRLKPITTMVMATPGAAVT